MPIPHRDAAEPTTHRSRARPWLLGLVAAWCVAAVVGTGMVLAQPDLSPRALEPEELDAATVRRAAARFELDTIVYDVLTETGIPGAVVAVALDGDVVAAEAYGTADVSTGRTLTLEDPLWLASVTKTVTAIAVLDLVAAGALDLATPLERLLAPGVVPPPPPGDATPLTTWHLLTHTSGFDERLLNTADASGGPNPPLADLPLPPRVDPAGSGPRYGNAGHHALGLVLEAVTGDDVERTLERLVFAPLGLTSARLLRPTDPAYDAATARGHERDAGGALQPLWPPTVLEPTAGQLRLSGRDAADLLAALTAADPPGPLGNDVRTALLTPAARPHPLAAGTTLGMTEGWLLGHEVVLQAGDLPGLHTLLVLVPSAALGIFVHVNGSERFDVAWSTADGLLDARWSLAERLLERFLGDARTPPTAVSTASLPEHARAEAGTYRANRLARTGPEAFLTLTGLAQVPLEIHRDGSLVVRTPELASPARRYVATEAGVYVRDHGGDALAVTRDALERPLVHGVLGMPVTLEPVPPLERIVVVLGCLLAAALAAIIALLSWPVGALRHWRARQPRGSAASGGLRLLRVTARLQAVATVVWFVVMVRAIDEVQRTLALDLTAWWPWAAWPLAAIVVLSLVLVLVGAFFALVGGSAGFGLGMRPRAALHLVLGAAGLALALQAWVWRLPPWS